MTSCGYQQNARTILAPGIFVRRALRQVHESEESCAAAGSDHEFFVKSACVSGKMLLYMLV